MVNTKMNTKDNKQIYSARENLNIALLNKVLERIIPFAQGQYSQDEFEIIKNELEEISGTQINIKSELLFPEADSISSIQDWLNKINEKESIQKKNGVYYTPPDVVSFIISNVIKDYYNALSEVSLDNTHFAVQEKNFCFEKTFFDPTCGTGVFLLEALCYKLEIFDLAGSINNDIAAVHKIVSTIKGNDINPDSIAITKIRMMLLILERYGARFISGIAKILEKCFSKYDYVVSNIQPQKYDFIVGNPPYVEDSKSGLKHKKRYGNIYANVLENAARQLNSGGVMGFIIPLSYVATPRMKKIRAELNQVVPEQHILNYSDRPDCLFVSVHQKLCIFLGRCGDAPVKIFTSNYQYWYREERDLLFAHTNIVENKNSTENFIPKLGCSEDITIYQKLQSASQSFAGLFESKETEHSVFLNMRATFWVKAFRNKHLGADYKMFFYKNKMLADFSICLLNSSLFWWFWVTVSDCWHITSKELNNFPVFLPVELQRASELALLLENKLEKTKIYVGTKQTDYEYKHKLCISEIHAIDDYIATIYGLDDDENSYIKNFALRYRLGGGAEK